MNRHKGQISERRQNEYKTAVAFMNRIYNQQARNTIAM